jgi:hypothetical protein
MPYLHSTARFGYSRWNRAIGGFFGKGRKFLGIYSGRVGDDTFLAQLGIVWKSRVIDEIIEGRKIGLSFFEI